MRELAIWEDWKEGAVFAVAVLWVVAWGLWAIALDNLPSQHDSLFPMVAKGHAVVLAGRWSAIPAWVASSEYHPPLPYAFGVLSSLLTGISLAKVRLSSLILHVVLLLQVYIIVRHLSRRRSTPLLAVWLCATMPGLAGWFRVDFPDPLTAVMVLATLQLALTTDLRGPGRAALLGAVAGLGGITKLGYDVVMLPAAVAYLALTLQGRRQLMCAIVALLAAFCTGGWWYFQQINDVLLNYSRSTSGNVPFNINLEIYFTGLPGNLAFTALAIASLVLAWLRRTAARRDLLLLLAPWLGGYFAFIFLFDPQGRYILPLLPLTCVLISLGIQALGARWAPRWRRTVMVGVAGVMALFFINLHLAPLPAEEHNGLMKWGLLRPDTRDYTGYYQARAAATALARRHLFVADSQRVLRWVSDQQAVYQLYRRNASWPIEDQMEARRYFKTGDSVYAIFAKTHDSDMHHVHPDDFMEPHVRDMLAWFLHQRREKVASFRDESSFEYTIYRLPRVEMDVTLPP